MTPDPIGGDRAYIELPCTSTRPQKGIAFCKLLTRVERDGSFALGFDGEIHKPGAALRRDELPERIVVLECAGPAGSYAQRKRETLWILWRYDKEESEWREIGRAAAASWEWAVVLRRPAYEALRAKPQLYDVLEMSRNVAAEIAELIHRRIEMEAEPHRVNILAAVHDRLCGEIARAMP